VSASEGVITVVIASPLEQPLVDRIASAEPSRVRVRYEEALVPSARYPSDHTGTPPTLSDLELDRWRSLVREADVMFDFDWLEPECLPEHAPQLRWVQATSSGIGEFLARTGLDRSRITFTTAAGVHAVPLAEFVVLGLLYFTKEMPTLRGWQVAHRWQRYTSSELAGRRVLVVGLGHVGAHIARSCAALGMDVWGARRTWRQEPVEGVTRLIELSQIREALPQVDALALACPYTPQTHHLIGRAELDLLSPSAIIVNVARGAVIDEAELIRALRSGGIKGAALDVFETEPLPVDSELWELPNVLVSPHSASTVGSENERIVDLFLDNLHRFLGGMPLRNRFDPDRGY
jgi:phosphoglycerate dehydrogenase-like enzyme